MGNKSAADNPLFTTIKTLGKPGTLIFDPKGTVIAKNTNYQRLSEGVEPLR